MENEQQPTTNDPANSTSADETRLTPPVYVRAEDMDKNDDTMRLAQPVGEAYDTTSYVRADAVSGDPIPGESGAATTDADPSAFSASPGEAGLVKPTHTPGGKTKRVKNRTAMKMLAALLVGAIVGGAAGGVVGSQMGGGITIQAVSTPRNTDEIAYDAEGNMTVSSIAAEATPAVVSVYNMTTTQPYVFGFGQSQTQSDSSGESTAQGYGSGVIISADGMIVTNYHVIEDADSVVVVTEDGTQYDATVLGTDANLDLALLQIDGSDLPYLTIADSDQVQVGDMAVAIGNPLGSQFANTVTDGIISGINRQISSDSADGIGYIQTNAAINNGNSGGALLNGQAQLIGINSMKVSTSGYSSASVEGMGFAIPSNTVLEFVNSVQDGSNTNTSTSRAWLGISGYTLDEDVANQVGIDRTSGILIASVTGGGPAYSAGLRMGDVITAVDGTEITSFTDLSTYLGSKQPGDTITLTVDRSGDVSDVQVTLGTEN